MVSALLALGDEERVVLSRKGGGCCRRDDDDTPVLKVEHEFVNLLGADEEKAKGRNSIEKGESL